MILLCSGVIIAYTLRVDISLAAPIMQEELYISIINHGLKIN
jgi:hypothetical protein